MPSSASSSASSSSPSRESTALFGADADELERAAQTLRSTASELDGHAGALTSTLWSVAWVGGVASRFASQWSGTHRPRIVSTSQYIREAAAALDRNAAEQRSASSIGSAGSSTSGTWSRPIDEGVDRLAQIGDLVDELGLDRDVLEIIADYADLLDKDGAVGRLIGMLTDDDFVKLLETADHVLDVGAFVIDVVTDFVDNPELSLDDRIVHSLADAAIRFGLNEGMEKAAEFLATAATTALLPGLGAVLAPVVGKAAGLIAEMAMDVVVGATDGATDVIDLAADAAVDIWHDVKASFGVLVDIGQAGVAVVTGAVDLAGDVAGAVGDATGATVDWLGDTAGGVVNGVGGVVSSINPFD